MDHPSAVGVGHRLADLLEDREESHPILIGTSARLQQRRQGAAPDQLHRDEQPAVGEAPQLVDRGDPGVLELAADLGLLDEPADHLGVVAVLLPDHLDGEVPAEVEVAPLEDRPHPAPGQLADELVARRLSREVGHLRRAGPDQPRGVRRVPEMDASDRPDRTVPDRTRSAGDAKAPVFPSRVRGRRSTPPSRIPAARSAERAAPSRSRQRGQSPAGDPAGRRAPQSGQISAPVIPATPPSGLALASMGSETRP